MHTPLFCPPNLLFLSGSETRRQGKQEKKDGVSDRPDRQTGVLHDGGDDNPTICGSCCGTAARPLVESSALKYPRTHARTGHKRATAHACAGRTADDHARVRVGPCGTFRAAVAPAPRGAALRAARRETARRPVPKNQIGRRPRETQTMNQSTSHRPSTNEIRAIRKTASRNIFGRC